MSDGDAFQAHLDAHPDDHTARLVFADWLQDRDDPRAEGYRALGRNGLHPVPDPPQRHTKIGQWRLYPSGSGILPPGPDDIPPDWLDAIKINIRGSSSAGDLGMRWNTRRQAENAAALAFPLLPADRRAELLAGAVHETA